MGPRTSTFDASRLLAPLGVDEFRAEYWEKRPLILNRRGAACYRGLLSLADFDRILATSSLRSQEIRVVHEGGERPLVPAEGGAPTAEQVLAHYREGATIVLQFIHERWLPLAALCEALAHEFSAGFQVNGYLTPRRAQGLGIHYDTHDVFVLQMEGSKHWRLFESPRKLPLPGQAYARAELASAKQVDELDLHAGGLLYLPRGVVHEAVSTDSTSLHLTVGVNSVTWAEVFLAALEAAIERRAELRESLPLGFARDGDLAKEAERRAASLLALLLSELSPKEIARDASARAELASRPVLDGHLLDIEAEPSIGLETVVARRAGVAWRLERERGQICLRFHGKKLCFPAQAEPDLRSALAARDPFTAASISGHLDDAGRLVMVRRLVREGALRIARPRAGADQSGVSPNCRGKV